jgi:glutamate synthase domain-containing protein 2
MPSYNSLKATPQHGSHLLKMVELKISQGATSGHGGVPRAARVSEEISRIRGVPIHQDYFSPSNHSRFSTAIGMMQFIGALRGLSASKPAGFPREPVRDAIVKDFEDTQLP